MPFHCLPEKGSPMSERLVPGLLVGGLLSLVWITPGYFFSEPLLQTGLLGQASGPQFPCLNPPTLSSDVPGDTPINDQASLNCFAWQEFISLNWPAAASGGGRPAGVGARDFGNPGDLRPVVWETFMDIHQVFNSEGSKPPPWGTPPMVPGACRRVWDGHRILTRTAKISIDFDAPEDINEAFPQGRPGWLADRLGNPVLYEIMIDEPEYDYIVQNGFYNAGTQYERVSAGVHVNLPRGVLDGDVGAIELKAAWATLPDNYRRHRFWRDRWRKYKLSEALVYDEADDDCEEVTVALVGLHILHKTTANPQWTWATFEHVDNSPDQQAVDDGTAEDRYVFFDPGCTTRSVPDSCRTLSVDGCRPAPDPPDQTSCVPNTEPAYCLDLGNEECPPYPIQVTRVNPIPNSGDNLVVQLNRAAQELIRSGANRDSVWQYYQLVGVLWSGAPVDEQLPGSKPPKTPLTISGMRPDTVPLPLSNTVLETYIQNATCVDCHQTAALAWSADDDTDYESFASDYSFVFQSANPPPPKK